MTHETEILVHITAPSTSIDDSIYRAFAQAYLDFQPQGTIELPGGTSPTVPAIQGHSAPSSRALTSPQLSFTSVWDNIKSPALEKGKGTNGSPEKGIDNSYQDGGISQDSWHAPPSEVADSMPDNDISMEAFNTPTRILKYFLQTAELSSQVSQETEPEDSTTMYEGNKDFISFHTQHNTVPEVYTSEQTPPVEEEPGPKRHSVELSHYNSRVWGRETHMVSTPSRPLRSRSVLAPPTYSSGGAQTRPPDSSAPSSQSEAESCSMVIPSTQLPERADSEPPAPKCVKFNRPRGGIQALGRSVSDILPRGSRNAASSASVLPDHVNSTSPRNLDWSAKTEIVSIEPMPSNYKLDPRPPVALASFVKKVGMAQRYKPKFQAREMRPYERGYWLLDLAGWDHGAKVETWGFLGNYIRRDNSAGWGTRACRDEPWNWIRLYGWEHIAGELYILLYVASYQRTKLMELTWYDGAGEKLIIVGARAERKDPA